jgi:uncharacterized phage-associated protein
MFRRILNNKIGNILAYMATQTEALYMTKALKLLYIIDEKAVRQSGSPITWLEYKVWKNGPVAHEIYSELRNNQYVTYNELPINLNNFIAVQRFQNGKIPNQIDVKINPLMTADFSQFSEFEEEIAKSVIAEFGHLNSAQLIDLLHEQGSVWHTLVTKFNLEEHFKVRSNTSDYSIDFVDLIEDDEFLKLAAQSAFESLAFQDNLLNTNLSFA